MKVLRVVADAKKSWETKNHVVPRARHVISCQLFRPKNIEKDTLPKTDDEIPRRTDELLIPRVDQLQTLEPKPRGAQTARRSTHTRGSVQQPARGSTHTPPLSPTCATKQ